MSAGFSNQPSPQPPTSKDGFIAMLLMWLLLLIALLLSKIKWE